MSIFSALFGDNESKKETQTQSQQTGSSVTRLPDWQMAFIHPAVNQVAGMLAPQYYTGALSAERSPLALAAEQMAQERATAGSPALHAAQDYARAVLGGGYLNANPYLNAMYDNAASRVRQNFTQSTLPAIASMFSAAGRYGPGAMATQADRAQQNLGDMLGRLATDIYGQNYARERAAMDTASAQAPGLAAADYYGPNVLSQMGTTADAYNQSAIDREAQRWQFNQLAPWQAEQARLAMLAADYGDRTTATTGTGSSWSQQTQAPPQQGMLSSLFGTGMSALGGGFGGLFGQGLAAGALKGATLKAPQGWK